MCHQKAVRERRPPQRAELLARESYPLSNPLLRFEMMLVLSPIARNPNAGVDHKHLKLAPLFPDGLDCTHSSRFAFVLRHPFSEFVHILP